MPLFEYACKHCGHQFETLVMGSTTPTCPSCSSQKLEKLLSVFAVNTSGGSTTPREATGPCGTCGDPRGPGACAWEN
jgi:putative FmdB family regulatory protein